MNRRSCNGIIASALMICVAYANVVVASTVVQRKDVVSMLQSHVILSKGLEESLGSERADLFRGQVQTMIAQKAIGLVPDVLTYPSSAGINDGVADVVIVHFDNAEYIDLAVTKALMVVVLDNRFQSIRMAEASDNTKRAINKNIEMYMEHMRRCLEANLVAQSPWFSKEEIEAEIGDLEKTLVASIDNPHTYWMTEAISETQVAKLAGGFESRVVAKRQDIGRLLQDALVRGTSTVDMAKLRHGILGKMTRAGGLALLESCVNPKLKSLKPEEFVPEYTEIVKNLSATELALARAENRKRLLLEEKRRALGPDFLEEGEQALAENIDKAISENHMVAGSDVTRVVGAAEAGTRVTSEVAEANASSGTMEVAGSSRRVWRFVWLVAMVMGGLFTVGVLVRRRRGFRAGVNEESCKC